MPRRWKWPSPSPGDRGNSLGPEVEAERIREVGKKWPGDISQIGVLGRKAVLEPWDPGRGRRLGHSSSGRRWDSRRRLALKSRKLKVQRKDKGPMA